MAAPPAIPVDRIQGPSGRLMTLRVTSEIGRLSSVLFPAFIWFATAIPARQRSGWLATFMAIQAFNAALFYTWRELF